MKIQKINENRINFESRHLYKAKIFWHSKSSPTIVPEDVFVSQINIEDIDKLSNSEFIKIQDNWGKNILQNLMELEGTNYEKDGKRFFAVEAPKKTGTKIRALGMVSYSKGEKALYVDYLQSFNRTNHWSIHGAGSCLLYGIIAYLAKKTGAKRVSLDSTKAAEKFYEKFGFNKPSTIYYDFSIPKRRFKKIKPPIRQTYHIERVG